MGYNTPCRNGYDYVQVGNSNMMCGRIIPEDMFINANSAANLNLKFKSDISRRHSDLGFRLEIIAWKCNTFTKCSTMQDPICASNNRTFINMCTFKREKECGVGSENIKVLHNGRCGGKLNVLNYKGERVRLELTY